MRALLLHQWRRHGVVLLLAPLGLFVFEWVLTRFAPSPAETARFGMMLQYLPQPLTDALGIQQPLMVGARQVLLFGYVHPFVILLFGLWTVRVAVGGMAGECGAGTMDLLASRPVSRAAILGSVAVTTAAGIAVCAAAAWAGTAVGVSTRDLGDVRPADFVWVAAGLALLFGAWAGVALFVSALHRHGGGASGIVAGTMAALFAVDYLARMWKPIHFLRWCSPFMYFEPKDVYVRGLATGRAAVLVCIAVTGAAGALFAFRRRDL